MVLQWKKDNAFILHWKKGVAIVLHMKNMSPLFCTRKKVAKDAAIVMH
jgi:hypothetical protein